METTPFELAIEIVRTLPSHDRQLLCAWIEEQERSSLNGAQLPDSGSREERFQRALQWLDENKANYRNQWVALDGDRLVASGADGKQVYAEAIAAGISSPLLHQITEDDELPLGGW